MTLVLSPALLSALVVLQTLAIALLAWWMRGVGRTADAGYDEAHRFGRRADLLDDALGELRREAWGSAPRAESATRSVLVLAERVDGCLERQAMVERCLIEAGLRSVRAPEPSGAAGGAA